MNNRSITPLPPADFTPEMGNYRTLQPFRYWCQKVLPLVYDDSLSYYELLCKVVDYLNKTMEDVDIIHTDVTNLLNAYNQLQNYVNNYFSSLDVQTEINNKLDNMASDGTLYDIIKKYTDPIVNEQNSKIHVLEQRMDEFTSLPDGSTSGDAELADIRVPAPNFNNGNSYPTAGDAVRGQVETLYNEKAEKLIYKKYETGSEQNSYYDFNFKIGNNYLIKNNSETSSCNISSIKSKSDRVIVENIATNLQANNVTFFTPEKEAKGLYIYTSGKSLIEIYNLTIIREYNETLGVYDMFDVTLYGVKPENDDNSDALNNLFDIIPSNINVKLYFYIILH